MSDHYALCPWPPGCDCVDNDFADNWEDTHILAICGGCGAYGDLGKTHYRKGEECGEFA